MHMKKKRFFWYEVNVCFICDKLAKQMQNTNFRQNKNYILEWKRIRTEQMDKRAIVLKHMQVLKLSKTEQSERAILLLHD